jgi:hypothetical protein
MEWLYAPAEVWHVAVLGIFIQPTCRKGTAARQAASDGTGFADLIVDGHRETWPLRSKRFQAWLRQQYYERTWDAPSPAALNAALNVLEAQAQFDGPQLKVSVRLAEQDGLIYLDLADEFWRCIEIGANGWRIAEDPPVRFRRSPSMQALPLPVRGGSSNLGDCRGTRISKDRPLEAEPARNAPNNHATTSTKALSLARFKNGRERLNCVKEPGGRCDIEEDVRAAHGVRPSSARPMAT